MKINNNNYNNLKEKENIILSIEEYVPSTENDQKCIVSISISSYLLRRLQEYSQTKYNSKNFCNDIVLNAIMVLLDKSMQHHTASLLYNGGKPKKDVLERLFEICKFLKLLESYPNLSPPTVRNAIKQNIGKDSRTFKKYVDCIRPLIIIKHSESGIGQTWQMDECVKIIENEFLRR